MSGPKFIKTFYIWTLTHHAPSKIEQTSKPRSKLILEESKASEKCIESACYLLSPDSVVPNINNI